MMRSCRLRPALGLALLLSAAPALCGTFTTGAATVSVNTTINSNCTISATPITFGSYDPIGANSASGIALTAPGTISLTCLKGSSPTIERRFPRLRAVPAFGCHAQRRLHLLRHHLGHERDLRHDVYAVRHLERFVHFQLQCLRQRSARPESERGNRLPGYRGCYGELLALVSSHLIRKKF